MDFKSLEGTRLVSRVSFPPRDKATLVSKLAWGFYEFHKQAATRLVELAKVRSGQLVIDIATGTGLAAIATAEAVGSGGSVLGTDFASGMLRQAQQKIADLALTNIEFEEADADEQQF